MRFGGRGGRWESGYCWGGRVYGCDGEGVVGVPGEYCCGICQLYVEYVLYAQYVSKGVIDARV